MLIWPEIHVQLLSRTLFEKSVGLGKIIQRHDYGWPMDHGQQRGLCGPDLPLRSRPRPSFREPSASSRIDAKRSSRFLQESPSELKNFKGFAAEKLIGLTRNYHLFILLNTFAIGHLPSLPPNITGCSTGSGYNISLRPWWQPTRWTVWSIHGRWPSSQNYHAPKTWMWKVARIFDDPVDGDHDGGSLGHVRCIRG
jgi:hypothetical protein